MAATALTAAGVGAVVLLLGLTGAVLPQLGGQPAVHPAADATVRPVSRGPVQGTDRWPPEPRSAPRSAPGSARAPAPGSRASDLPARGPVVRAADLLRAWDERRARAWAAGDAAALRELYVDRAGVADVRLLRRYTGRGLRVEGLTTQLLAVEVLGRGPDRWRLRVTDRVAGGVVVGGGQRLRLRPDRVDTRIVTLVRRAGADWQVAVVRPDRP